MLNSVILCYTHAQSSLTKLMVSHDLARTTAIKQIAFHQRGLDSTPEFERAMDRHCRALIHHFYLTDSGKLSNSLEHFKASSNERLVLRM